MTKTTSSELQTRFVKIVQLLLAALIIYLLTRATLAFFAPESLWKAPDAVPIKAVTQQTTQNSRLDTSFDPFHRTHAAKDEIIEYGTDVPETTLNLKLYGRRAGKNGSAILETTNKVQKVFRVGEEIMDGVTLKAVNPEYIVLSQGGRIERLTFARDEENLLTPPEDKDITNTASTSTNVIKAIPQELSVSTLMASINLSPSTKAGTLQGFRISPKNGKVNLTSFGLNHGDIVSAIDDIDLTSPSLNPAQLPARLAEKNQVKLTVLRGSKTVFVTVKNKS